MNKAQATQQGQRLLKRMQGTGWKLRVWKNFGWYFGVENGGISVFGDVTYLVLLHEGDTPGGGSAFWHTGKRFRDPNRAVQAQLKHAQKFVTGLQGGLDALTQRLQTKKAKRATKKREE